MACLAWIAKLRGRGGCCEWSKAARRIGTCGARYWSTLSRVFGTLENVGCFAGWRRVIKASRISLSRSTSDGPGGGAGATHQISPRSGITSMVPPSRRRVRQVPSRFRPHPSPDSQSHRRAGQCGVARAASASLTKRERSREATLRRHCTANCSGTLKVIFLIPITPYYQNARIERVLPYDVCLMISSSFQGACRLADRHQLVAAASRAAPRFREPSRQGCDSRAGPP